MKYKVGDKVRIIKNKSCHKFPIGEIITIEDIYDNDSYLSKDKNRNIWYYGEDEIELVESGDKNMECNYEMIGKRETIECLLSDEIGIDEIHKIYAVDMKNEEINGIHNMYFEEIMNELYRR